jgi:hypothetical protein
MKKDLKLDDQKWRKNVKRSINNLFYFFAALPLFASMVSAQEPSVEKVVPSFEQGHSANETDMPSGYNASARINVNGAWDVFLNGSYILWQPRESGLDIARKVPSDVTRKQSCIKMDFDYSSGFKVAFGTNLNHDGWTAIAEYTRLHTRNHVSSDAPTGYTFSQLWLEYTPNTVGVFNAASGHWQVKYDMIDLAFGRPCYTGTHLVFKPHFGLRGGWIDQHLDAKYTTTTATELSSWNKSNSWLIGPRAGFGMNWLLGAGFRILANGAGSLIYQESKIHHTEASSDVVNFVARNKGHQIAPNAEADMGFGWGTYFDNNNWHFDLLASYHFEAWWNQNQMRNYSDNIGSGNFTKSGILAFHGLTVTAQLDF